MERRTNPADRRVNLLHLTPAARPLVAEIEAEAERLRVELLDGVSYEDYQIALAVIEKLRERLS